MFAHNESLPVAPASNEKIPVSWAALTRLGVGYRFHTEVYGVGARAGATWNGDLILKGFGDPTLSAADIDRLAATIRGRGIRVVNGPGAGRRVASTTRSVARQGGSATSSAARPRPCRPSSSIAPRGWPALSPPLLAARALRDALSRRGVAVVGRPGLGVAPDAAVSLASDVSDPLSQIVRRMNHESDNFYAEMLLKQLAAATGKVGTSVGGGRVVIATMREAGIPVGGVRIVDGSGPVEPRPPDRRMRSSA